MKTKSSKTKKRTKAGQMASLVSGPLLGVSERGPRGFPKVSFADAYGHESSIQASSAIGDYDDSFDRPGSSYIWLGLEGVKAQVMARDAHKVGVTTAETTGWVDYPIPDDVSIWTRMHLNREQVAGLIGRLQQWLAQGNFDSPNKKIIHAEDQP